jgi:hypothetical protein
VSFLADALVVLAADHAADLDHEQAWLRERVAAAGADGVAVLYTQRGEALRLLVPF